MQQGKEETTVRADMEKGDKTVKSAKEQGNIEQRYQLRQKKELENSK